MVTKLNIWTLTCEAMETRLFITLKEAQAYHQHRIHGRVDPVADGVSAED